MIYYGVRDRKKVTYHENRVWWTKHSDIDEKILIVKMVDLKPWNPSENVWFE